MHAGRKHPRRRRAENDSPQNGGWCGGCHGWLVGMMLRGTMQDAAAARYPRRVESIPHVHHVQAMKLHVLLTYLLHSPVRPSVRLLGYYKSHVLMQSTDCSNHLHLGSSIVHTEQQSRRFAACRLDADDYTGPVVVGNVGDNSVSRYRLNASETQQLADATPICYLCGAVNQWRAD